MSKWEDANNRYNRRKLIKDIFYLLVITIIGGIIVTFLFFNF